MYSVETKSIKIELVPPVNKVKSLFIFLHLSNDDGEIEYDNEFNGDGLTDEVSDALYEKSLELIKDYNNVDGSKEYSLDTETLVFTIKNPTQAKGNCPLEEIESLDFWELSGYVFRRGFNKETFLVASQLITEDIYDLTELTSAEDLESKVLELAKCQGSYGGYEYAPRELLEVGDPNFQESDEGLAWVCYDEIWTELVKTAKHYDL